MTTRRRFLHTGLVAASGVSGAALVSKKAWGHPGREGAAQDRASHDSLPHGRDAKKILHVAVDVAKQHGAQYADARLTETQQLHVNTAAASKEVVIQVGVRALVGGIWGFAAGPILSHAELARLGKEAVHQAKSQENQIPRTVSLAAIEPVMDGEWVMPVKTDPFEMNPTEIIDYLNGLGVYVKRTPGAAIHTAQASFSRQYKAYVSSENNSYNQRTYRSQGVVSVVRELSRSKYRDQVSLLTPAGKGWELFSEQPVHEEIRQILEQMLEEHKLPLKPVDIGRHTAVLDAASVASLLSETIGAATELDRVQGYEANSGGTSYFNNPLEDMGNYKVGSNLLSVSGDRSSAGGVATVKWDDDAAIGMAFPIINKGTLVDFSSSRESSSWIREAYEAQNLPVMSRGCSYAPSAIDIPMTHTPNLSMNCGVSAANEDSLLSTMGDGVQFRRVVVDMDFQKKSGLAYGKCFEVRAGKRVAKYPSAGILFRTPELWNNLSLLGGETSQRRFGIGVKKGEPPQQSYHSVTSVPVAINEVALVNIGRRA